MTNEIISSQGKNIMTSDNIQQFNAVKIKLNDGVKLSNEDKFTLKKTNLITYDTRFDAYVAPIGQKESIQKYLEEKNIDAKISEFKDLDIERSRQLRNLDTQIDILRAEIKDIDDYVNIQLATTFKPYSIFEFIESLEEIKATHENGLKSEILKRVIGFIEDSQQKKEKLQRLIESRDRLERSKSQDETIIDAFHKNEIGDALLFTRKFKEKYVFDYTDGKEGAYYRWSGENWVIDDIKERFHDFDKISEQYLKASQIEHIDDELKKGLASRYKALKTASRRSAVFQTIAAHIPLKKPWDDYSRLLPCKNGIVNLVTGEISSHNPEHYNKKCSQVLYDKEAKCPIFLKFLQDVSGNNQEWIDFLQLLIGYASLGVPKEHIVIYLYGKNGRNGKGTLFKVISHVLGEFLHNCKSSLILENRSDPNPEAASPDLANLEGVRVALFSEIPKNKKVNEALLKNWSGGDTISCRRLFSGKDLQIEPKFTMFIQTNEKPRASADDNAFWERQIVLPFNISFVREPVKEHERYLDEGIADKLLEESSGVLNWIIAGAKRYAQEGFKLPQLVKDEVKLYRDSNNPVKLFIDECCSIDEYSTVSKSVFKKAVYDYCKDNGLYRPDYKNLVAFMESNFDSKRIEEDRTRCWAGLRLDL